MLEFEAAAFYEATRLMQHTLTYVEATNATSHTAMADGGVTIKPITDRTALKIMRERNAQLRASLEVLGANITLMVLDEFDADLHGPYPTYESLMVHSKDVSKTLRRELTQTKLLALNSQERLWFDPPEPLFGAPFVVQFNTHGAFELEEASKCLALGRPTAAVFHLMRLLEVGIGALSLCLSIPDPIKPAERNWGVILRRIMEDGIKMKWPNAADRMSGDGKLFEELHASLDAVKNPFRNATMHVESKYTDAEAQHILALVKGFMMKLAGRCDEGGNPKV